MNGYRHNPLVSIVIPVYKVEEYLGRCLDSIEAIDYKPIEVIIVNDASPDNCGQIINRYLKSNPEWTAIHKQVNEGVTRARVSGEEKATGEYVMFVDSDDYVHPDIISRLVSVALDSKADITCCGFYIDNAGCLSEDDRNADAYYDSASLDYMISERLLFDNHLKKAALPVCLWAKLFRNKTSELISALLEGNLYIYEDMITMMSYYINNTESVACIKDPLYYYVKRPGQTTDISSVNAFDNRVLAWDKLDKINDGRFSDQLSFRMFAIIKNTLYDLSAHSSFNEYIAFIRHLVSIPVIKKYIFNNKSNAIYTIKRHPHYFLTKYRLFWLDYLFSNLIVK